MLIDDGKGRGNSVGVSDNNMLTTLAITSSLEHYTNHTKGKAFNLLFGATPASTGDCFLYIKNSSDIDLIAKGFSLKLAASEYIDVKLGDIGTPSGGTDITPVNLNSGSGVNATGTFQNGADIISLSGGATIERYYHLSSVASLYRNFEQDVVLKKNGVLTMYAQTGGTVLAGTLVFNYHDDED